MPVDQLHRLCEALADKLGEIDASFEFERDNAGRAFVVLDCRGAVNLRCERCLGAFRREIALHQRMPLADARFGIKDADEDVVSVGEDGLFMRDLIEDEILLALPLIPRHATIEACDPDAAAWLVKDGNEKSEGLQADSASGPFGVLRTLKDKD
ncbi:YceD family protein [Acidihalobacter aeolianus]|uniref:YceD family protein n=1 Tax=Acidihalobacter aeolianus TaxID=2792603 RepID=UPI0018D46E47|nr:YceD family protein [Acidihalobacter aeolianus]